VVSSIIATNVGSIVRRTVVMQHPIYDTLIPLAEPEKVNDYSRYFQNYQGGYGEGDMFIGVNVPNRRLVAKNNALKWGPEVLAAGLRHPCHEVRHTALFALMRRFGAERQRRSYWHDFLRDHYEGINNWDLVDTCAYHIFGRMAYERDDYSSLEAFLASDNIWHKRTAVVATLHMIKRGRFDEALAYSQIAAKGAPDILQKGIGWVLKCVWQRDSAVAEAHLEMCYISGLYPRLVVRISLEKTDKDFRKAFLAMR